MPSLARNRLTHVYLITLPQSLHIFRELCSYFCRKPFRKICLCSYRFLAGFLKSTIICRLVDLLVVCFFYLNLKEAIAFSREPGCGFTCTVRWNGMLQNLLFTITVTFQTKPSSAWLNFETRDFSATSCYAWKTRKYERIE